MRNIDELVGLWDSSLFEYGSMEASRLALLANGSGWGVWENAAGGMGTVEVRPLLARDGNPALWPSERGDRIGLQRINGRLASYRDASVWHPAWTSTRCAVPTSRT